MIEEQKRILKLVEDGKLTAEEAILLIEKLSNVDSGMNQAEKEAEIRTELSAKVDYEHTRQGSSFDQKATSVKNKFMDFVDSAFKKIKDMDLDFNFGDAIEVKHIFQHSNVNLTKIDLDVANGSITIIPWGEKDVRIECDAKVYKIENQVRARKAFLEDVRFSIEDGKLLFLIQQKQMKVNAKIYVPNENYENVKVRMFNGPINGENLVVQDFRAKTANGAVTVTNFVTTSMEVETANGHIKAENIESKEFEAETINGTVTVGGRFEKVDLQSFNGNITCSLAEDSCHTAYIKTTTGTIHVFVSDAYEVDGELKSNLGSFKAELPVMSIIEEKNDIVQKSLRFKANQDKGNKLYLFAETKTGSIEIKPI
ncbi:DUF4097 family beta strand repeat-containing protein [Ferdinandcohnia quinoae]|uniref:DUF4097 family beta strand repeat-containing protein n=1 Tax=Fredinandcohnia quinoae TaxID=2918902 RepID=A0AAW5DYS7_9BACI|nr:DUF4097 domain-containing protein [Fredinandcohnia sp. SECRCQ15]MCH1625801.1 DUF4097 family beta strand repeat-containing protein [Fredinandcohnia sp. SECRCQ15]